MVCVPYSIDNLHRMASDLGIKRCWFHKNHYDIPIYMLEIVETECILVSTRDVLKIIKGLE